MIHFSLSLSLSTGSFEDFERQHRHNVEEKDRLQTKKEQLSTEEANLLKRSVMVQRELGDLESTLSSARLDGSKAIEVENAIKKEQSKLVDIENRKIELLRDREIFQRETTLAKNELTIKQREYDTLHKTLMEKQESLKRDTDDYQRVLVQSEQLDRQFQDMNLGSVDDSLERLKNTINIKQNDIDKINPNILKLTQEVNSEEHVKRNVQGNIDLRILRRDLIQYRQQLHDLQEKSGGIQALNQLEQAEREKKLRERERQTLQSERDVSKGKLTVLQQNIQETMKKLNHPDYRDVDKRHRKINIEFETTNLAVVDLTNYHSAL